MVIFSLRELREVGKANEALARIGMGLAANPSVTEPEMLLYVHATVAPFLLPQVSFKHWGKHGLGLMRHWIRSRIDLESRES